MKAYQVVKDGQKFGHKKNILNGIALQKLSFCYEASDTRTQIGEKHSNVYIMIDIRHRLLFKNKYLF